MELIWSELAHGLPDRNQLFRVLLRLVMATLLGAIVGAQREHRGKSAGLRTHMLVCLGACLFVLASTGAGMQLDDISRVIQGIVVGIGFIGTGSILKLDHDHHIQGLTTAAGVWMMAAIGITVGLGSVGLALLGTLFVLIILALAKRIERHIRNLPGAGGDAPASGRPA